MKLLVGRLEPKLLLAHPMHRPVRFQLCTRCGRPNSTRSHVPMKWLMQMVHDLLSKKVRKDFPKLEVRPLCRPCHDVYGQGELRIVKTHLLAAAVELIEYHGKFVRGES